MAALRYYGNIMTTTIWRLVDSACCRCIWVYSCCCRCILHLQQYSRRLNLFFFSKFWQLVSTWLVANIWNNKTKNKVATDKVKILFHFNIILQTQQDVLYQALIHLTDFSKNLSSCFRCCLHNWDFYHHRRSSFCVPFCILWRTRCLIYV